MGNWFGNYFGRRGLMVELDPQMAATLAPKIEALDLAEKVMAYWDSQTL